MERQGNELMGLVTSGVANRHCQTGWFEHTSYNMRKRHRWGEMLLDG